MSVLTPQQAEQLVTQRRLARRALGQGRRWYLRGVLMFLISVIAGYRGGQVNVVIGIIMVVLAAMCYSLGRSMRRNARESLNKIDLMERSASQVAVSDSSPRSGSQPLGET